MAIDRRTSQAHSRYRCTVSRSAQQRLARSHCLVLIACWALSCAGSEDCPNDLPDDTDCSTNVPSYSSQVSGVIEQYCNVCHYPGNLQSTRILSDYDHIFASRRTSLSQIYGCRMPIGPRRLSARNRALLLKWFVCGAPNN